MRCDVYTDINYGAGSLATLNDGVGTNACSDEFEIAVVAASLSFVLLALVRVSPSAAVAVAVSLVSLHNAVFGLPVRHGTAATAYTRQAGGVAVYAALFGAYIALMVTKGTASACCVAYGWIGAMSTYFGALGVVAGVYQTDAGAMAYEVLDWTGVLLGIMLIITA